MSNCRDCRWWARAPEKREGKSWDYCNRIDPDGADRETLAHIDAVSTLEVRFFTSPNFGCVMFRGPDSGPGGPELKEPAEPDDKGNMNIKAITVVVGKRDVSISRTNTPHARQAHAVQVQVVIHHPNQRNVAVPYTVTGEDSDLKAAQTIIERATSQGWEKTHTTSMVRDLVDVLRSVAGV